MVCHVHASIEIAISSVVLDGGDVDGVKIEQDKTASQSRHYFCIFAAPRGDTLSAPRAPTRGARNYTGADRPHRQLRHNRRAGRKTRC